MEQAAAGSGGVPMGDEPQIANSVYTAGLSVGYLLMLVHRRHPDRLGVPAPDHHEHVPRAAEAAPA